MLDSMLLAEIMVPLYCREEVLDKDELTMRLKLATLHHEIYQRSCGRILQVENSKLSAPRHGGKGHA